MQFVDEVKVFTKSGKGGAGCVSMMSQSYMPKMGPDGGDGGRGGHVYFEATHNMQSLLDFKFKPKFEAKDGQPGMGKDCFGKGGDDIVIKVPVGTMVKDSKTGEVLLDLLEDGSRVMFLKGGRGGMGNMNFATATRQAPDFAQPGEMGESREVKLELKLIADIGLVGFPNAGKSTLISSCTKAKPKIGSYPFTTLVPNLGLRRGKGLDFVIADIPGLIEGAADGKGLGDRFLRHCERTRLLVMVLDLDPHTQRSLPDEFTVLRKELDKYSSELSSKEYFIFLNKIDAFEQIPEEKNIAELDSILKQEEKCLGVYKISAVSGQGVEEALGHVEEKLRKLGPRVLKNAFSDTMIIGERSLIGDGE